MVIFCGDFYQIPPVASDPVFLDPGHSTRKAGVLDETGYRVWQNLGHTIILEPSMRHIEDRDYSHCLRRVRKGLTTRKDLDQFNSRVISYHSEQRLKEIGAADIPLVVRNNDLRMSLNWRCVEEYSECNQGKQIVCVAKLETKSRRNLTLHYLGVLFDANDADTATLCILLPMVTGMPIRITKNVCIDLGIANGTEGMLSGVEFPANTTFQEASFFGIDCILSSELPNVAYVSSNLFKNKLEERFPHLPQEYGDDTIPIAPVTETGISPKIARKLLSKETINVTKLPIVPTFSSMTYKVQGKTFSAIIAFPFVRGCNGLPPSASLYVVLSRVRSLSSFFLTERILEEDLRHFIPPKELVTE